MAVEKSSPRKRAPGHRRPPNPVGRGRATRNRQIRVLLGEVIGQLEQLHSTLAVAVGALRQQNADIDADVARLLQRAVGDKIQGEIERLEAALRLLPSGTARKRKEKR
jgi:hypothetical protein